MLARSSGVWAILKLQAAAGYPRPLSQRNWEADHRNHTVLLTMDVCFGTSGTMRFMRAQVIAGTRASSHQLIVFPSLLFIKQNPQNTKSKEIINPANKTVERLNTLLSSLKIHTVYICLRVLKVGDTHANKINHRKQLTGPLRICRLVKFAGSEVSRKGSTRRTGPKKTLYSVCITTNKLLGKEAVTSTPISSILPCQESK